MLRPPTLLRLATSRTRSKLSSCPRCYSALPSALKEPTIFAPATGRGKTAISILRISGPDALSVWRDMTRPPRQQPDRPAVRPTAAATARDPPARKAMLRRIVHPGTDEVLDEGIVLYFPGEQERFGLLGRSLDKQPNSQLGADRPAHPRAARPWLPCIDGAAAQPFTHAERVLSNCGAWWVPHPSRREPN